MPALFFRGLVLWLGYLGCSILGDWDSLYFFGIPNFRLPANASLFLCFVKTCGVIRLFRQATFDRIREYWQKFHNCAMRTLQRNIR
jgi:hypothetical protein